MKASEEKPAMAFAKEEKRCCRFEGVCDNKVDETRSEARKLMERKSKTMRTSPERNNCEKGRFTPELVNFGSGSRFNCENCEYGQYWNKSPVALDVNTTLISRWSLYLYKRTYRTRRSLLSTNTDLLEGKSSLRSTSGATAVFGTELGMEKEERPRQKEKGCCGHCVCGCEGGDDCLLRMWCTVRHDIPCGKNDLRRGRRRDTQTIQRVVILMCTTFLVLSGVNVLGQNVTEAPTAEDTSSPTASPVTEAPTGRPVTEPPTGRPVTEAPTRRPVTEPPTRSPSLNPSVFPTKRPTLSPLPSFRPSTSLVPSIEPTGFPTAKPSPAPTTSFPPTVSKAPNPAPSSSPSISPSTSPTISSAPTDVPTNFPTTSAQPSSEPTPHPSAFPTSSPSARPSSQPTFQDASFEEAEFQQQFLLLSDPLGPDKLISFCQVMEVYSLNVVDEDDNEKLNVTCTEPIQTRLGRRLEMARRRKQQTSTGVNIQVEIEYTMTWVSKHFDVEPFKDSFKAFINENLEGVTDFMLEQGVPIIKAFTVFEKVKDPPPTPDPSTSPSLLTPSPNVILPDDTSSPSESPTKHSNSTNTTNSTLAPTPNDVIPTLAPTTFQPSVSPSPTNLGGPPPTPPPSSSPSSSPLAVPSDSPSMSPTPETLSPVDSGGKKFEDNSGMDAILISSIAGGAAVLVIFLLCLLYRRRRRTSVKGGGSISTGSYPDSRRYPHNGDRKRTDATAVVIGSGSSKGAPKSDKERAPTPSRGNNEFYVHNDGDVASGQFSDDRVVGDLDAFQDEEERDGSSRVLHSDQERHAGNSVSNGDFYEEGVPDQSAVDMIPPIDSLVSNQSLLSTGLSISSDSGHEADTTHHLADEFDQYKDQNLEKMRTEVERTVTNFDGEMSQALTKALMDDDDSNKDFNELTWGGSSNSTEIECIVLFEMNDWLKKKGDEASLDDRRSFIQKTLNKMVSSVRHGIIAPEEASRAIHGCAALLGLQLAEGIPETALIVTGMRKKVVKDQVIKAFEEFGEIEDAAVAPGEKGFGIVRFKSPKSVQRAMDRFKAEEIEVQDVAVMIKVLKSEKAITPRIEGGGPPPEVVMNQLPGRAGAMPPGPAPTRLSSRDSTRSGGGGGGIEASHGPNLDTIGYPGDTLGRPTSGRPYPVHQRGPGSDAGSHTSKTSVRSRTSNRSYNVHSRENGESNGRRPRR